MAKSSNVLTDKSAVWTSFASRRASKVRPNFDIYAAAYLPFCAGGHEIDWDGFARVLQRIWDCGAIPVVNADTGFAFHPLVAPRKAEILQWIQRNFSGRPYVAAVTPPAAQAARFSSAAYNEQIETALSNGATEIMVMISPGVTCLNDDALVVAYNSLKIPSGKGILHELTNEFVPFGRQFTPYEFYSLMSLPAFGASKTSDLFGDCMSPRMGLKASAVMTEARILSGVDYKIEEAFRICDGILMGAATIWPELYVLLLKLYREGVLFADRMWKFETLVRNMQSVATHQFRPDVNHLTTKGLFDVGGYRHLTAMYLRVQGTIVCAEQPNGTAEHHLRPSSEVTTVIANCHLIRKTLEAIGENPDILKLS